jgi:hypothetical protein
VFSFSVRKKKSIVITYEILVLWKPSQVNSCKGHGKDSAETG